MVLSSCYSGVVINRVSCTVMLLRLAYLPIIFWLLLPPGICLCKYSCLAPFVLGRLTGIQTVLPSEPDTGREEDDWDHAPWCPRNKMVYAHLALSPTPSTSAPLPLTLDPTDLASGDVGAAVAAETVVLPCIGRGTTDRYLILRALRI
jgi:hypothetical protein